jgi:hypothetical protein
MIMRKIKIVTVIFLFLISNTFISCDVEPIDPALNVDDFGGNTNGPAFFRADFSGATWNAAISEAVLSGNLITIAGTKQNGESFGFLISGNQVGTYPANTNLLSRI